MSILDRPAAKPTDSGPQCGNCLYYRFDEGLTALVNHAFLCGRCYAHPPVYIGSAGTVSDPILWEFPGVRGTDFCSEFKLNPSPAGPPNESNS